MKKYTAILLLTISITLFAQDDNTFTVRFTDGSMSEVTIHSANPGDAKEHLVGFSILHFKINQTPVGPFTPELIHYRFDPNNRLNYHANLLFGLIDYRLVEKDNLAEYQFKRIQGHFGVDYAFYSNLKRKKTAMRWYNGTTIYKIPLEWPHQINYNARGGLIYKQRGTGNRLVSDIVIDTLNVERTDQLEGYRQGIIYLGLSRTKKMYMSANGTGLGKIETTKHNELYMDFMISPVILQYGRTRDYSTDVSPNYDVNTPSRRFDKPAPFENVIIGGRIGGFQMVSRPKNPNAFMHLGWELGYYPGPKPHNFEFLFKFAWFFGVGK